MKNSKFRMRDLKKYLSNVNFESDMHEVCSTLEDKLDEDDIEQFDYLFRYLRRDNENIDLAQVLVKVYEDELESFPEKIFALKRFIQFHFDAELFPSLFFGDGEEGEILKEIGKIFDSIKETSDKYDEEKYNIFCMKYDISGFERKLEKKTRLEEYILKCIEKYDFSEKDEKEFIKDMILFILLIPNASPRESFFNHMIEKFDDDLLTFEKKVSLVLELGKDEKVRRKYVDVLVDYGVERVKEFFPRAIEALNYSCDELAYVRDFLTKEAEEMMRVSDEELLMSKENFTPTFYRGRREAMMFLEHVRTLNGKDKHFEKYKKFLEEWTIPKIIEYLSKTIVGQDAAKLTVAYAVIKHIERLCYPELELETMSSLFIGASGSGKTKLWQLVDDILPDNIHVYEVYSPSITVAGFQGEELIDVLNSIYKRHGEDSKNTIVIFDEADKALKSTYSSTNNIDYGKQLQSELLQVIQGISHITKEHRVINTCNMMFVFCGAFSDMDRSSNTQKKCGFEYVSSDVKEIKDRESLELALENFGFIPEFLARIKVITEMETLKLDDYERILTDSNSSPIIEAQKRASLRGITVTFTDASIKMIAKIAKLSDLNLGVRQMGRIIESVMRKKMTEAAYDTNISEILVDEEDVKNYGR